MPDRIEEVKRQTRRAGERRPSAGGRVCRPDGRPTPRGALGPLAPTLRRKNAPLGRFAALGGTRSVEAFGSHAEAWEPGGKWAPTDANREFSHPKVGNCGYQTARCLVSFPHWRGMWAPLGVVSALRSPQMRGRAALTRGIEETCATPPTDPSRFGGSGSPWHGDRRSFFAQSARISHGPFCSLMNGTFVHISCPIVRKKSKGKTSAPAGGDPRVGGAFVLRSALPRASASPRECLALEPDTEEERRQRGGCQRTEADRRPHRPTASTPPARRRADRRGAPTRPGRSRPGATPFGLVRASDRPTRCRSRPLPRRP